MQAGEDLLAVRVADRHGPHAGADDAQGRLVQVNGHGVAGVRPPPRPV